MILARCEKREGVKKMYPGTAAKPVVLQPTLVPVDQSVSLNGSGTLSEYGRI